MEEPFVLTMIAAGREKTKSAGSGSFARGGEDTPIIA
jgi:hypothetical protein